jgi:voltage-gated potassium channel
VDQRSERIQQRLEWPVITAAFLTIPILMIQESDFGQPWQALGEVLNWATWGVFFAEVVVMLSVVPDRRAWLRTHMLDVAVTVLTPPFAPAAWQAGRVFRLFRLLRLARLFSLRRLLSLEGVKYAALLAVGTILVGGAVYATVEKVGPDGQALSTWDGVWWAITTVTTVGYGDNYPVTDGGRMIAMAIMAVGIGFVALLTAFVADRFINEQQTTEAKEDQILDELRQIRERLDQLET